MDPGSKKGLRGQVVRSRFLAFPQFFYIATIAFFVCRRKFRPQNLKFISSKLKHVILRELVRIVPDGLIQLFMSVV